MEYSKERGMDRGDDGQRWRGERAGTSSNVTGGKRNAPFYRSDVDERADKARRSREQTFYLSEIAEKKIGHQA